jgi:hypoxanthine phosphoribosyltransferase
VSKLQVLISKEQIDKRVDELAAEIRRDYADRNPLLIGALKGSFVFMSDLMRKLNVPVEVEFIRLSSYGAGMESSGRIKLVQGVRTPVKDRHVLVVEDIVDTGLTLRFLLDYLRRRKPASVKLCALLDKPSRRVVDVPIDYLGFTVPNKFIVGCGIDFNEEFRYLPDIYTVEGE